MKHRIRAAAIIIKEEKLLLVKHVHPESKFTWWVPPGGGVEQKDDSVTDCVKRETFEETGYEIEVGELLFVREFLDSENQTLNLELFFSATIVGGELTLANIHGTSPDADFIKQVKWISPEEISDITVFPPELKNNFARNENNIYLGRQNG